MRDLSGQPFVFFACVCMLSDYVCLGSDADVSPVIGIQAPCLPVGVCVLFGVRKPNYSGSDSCSRQDM